MKALRIDINEEKENEIKIIIRIIEDALGECYLSGVDFRIVEE